MKMIFIGSSSEALPYAEAVRDVLSPLPGIGPKLWNTCFKPGFVPLEGIDAVVRECSGAVFLATPDDPARIRDKDVMTSCQHDGMTFAGCHAAHVVTHVTHVGLSVCRSPKPTGPSFCIAWNFSPRR